MSGLLRDFKLIRVEDIKPSLKIDWREPLESWIIPLENLRMVKHRTTSDIDRFEVKIDDSINLILDYRDDGEEREIYSRHNLIKIKQFLLSLRRNLLQEFNLSLNMPYILPGPDGSIDIHWDLSKYKLLINFPRETSEEITVVGHRNRKNVIKLSTEPQNAIRGLINWLYSVMI